jgi:hypothetical protein
LGVLYSLRSIIVKGTTARQAGRGVTSEGRGGLGYGSWERTTGSEHAKLVRRTPVDIPSKYQYDDGTRRCPMRDEEEKTARFELRLPVSLRQRLQERAREHHRSLNSEIVDALTIAAEHNVAGRIQQLEKNYDRLSNLLPAIIMTIEGREKLGGRTFRDFLEEALRQVVDEESK